MGTNEVYRTQKAGQKRETERERGERVVTIVAVQGQTPLCFGQEDNTEGKKARDQK